MQPEPKTRQGEGEPAVTQVWELDVPLMPPPFRKSKTQVTKPPSPREPLNANFKLHWREKGRRTRTVREVVATRAKVAKIPPLEHITVTLHYQPGNAQRRDPGNLMPTSKPAVDALVDAGIVPDDTTEFVHENIPVIHPGPGTRRLWLEVAVTQGREQAA